jgi:hypothetical protein
MVSYEEVCLLQSRLRKMADDLEDLKGYLKSDKKEEFHHNNDDLKKLFGDLAGLKNDNNKNKS